VTGDGEHGCLGAQGPRSESLGIRLAEAALGPTCGTVIQVLTALKEMLVRHVGAGTVPGAVALLASGDVEVVAAGVASIGGGPMRDDAIMRIQSMTKAITSVAALRLVEARRLELDQSLEAWLPELSDRRVLSSPTAALDDTVPARRPITLRHLLTNASGYGMAIAESPLQRAMADNGTEAGSEPLRWGQRSGSPGWPNFRSRSNRGKVGVTTTRSACSASSSRG
jgi:CubicO group peptidase (beta-lactamase class C family)